MPTSLLALVLFGCTQPEGDDSSADSGTPTPAAPDPFSPMEDASGGLTNVSADLEAVLENGSLDGACDDWESDPSELNTLRCGKWMFFNESFGTAGAPSALIDFLVNNLPDQVGPGFEKQGMFLDPYSTKNLPVGMAPGAPMGNVPTYAFTCASCHLGQLPDGRYAVGAPNHDYDYGQQNLLIAVLPGISSPGADPSSFHPDAVAEVQAAKTAIESDTTLQLTFFFNLLPLIGATVPEFSKENQGHYAHWKPGTMDFFIEPLPTDDGTHTVHRIPPLWGMPDAEEQSEYGMDHALLGWTGNTTSLANFLDGFVVLGGSADESWTPERVAPLETYLRSLTPPAPPAQDADAVSRGATVFADAGCLECHSGARGSGLRPYTFEEVGTDPGLGTWLDPELDGSACCDVDTSKDPLTNGVKSPRLVGLWAQERFLHNGSVESLEQLLCLAPREGITEPGYGDGGHEQGCELPEAEREDLLVFLRSH